MAIVDRVRIIIEIGCLLRAGEAYTTPLRDQRGLPFTAFHYDLQNVARSVVCLDARCKSRIDLLHRNAELIERVQTKDRSMRHFSVLSWCRLYASW